MTNARPLLVCLLVLLPLAVPAPSDAAVPLGGLAVAVTADGSRLVAGGDTRALYELDPATLAVKGRTYIGRPIVALAFSKDGKRLLVEGTKAVLLLDAGSLKPIQTLESVERIAVAPEADRFAVLDRSKGAIRVLSMQDGLEQASLDYDRMKTPAGFGLSPDGKQAAMLYYRRKAEAETKVPHKEMPKDLKGAARNEFKQRHDGYGARWRVWDVASGKTTLDTKLWFSTGGGGNVVFFHGGHAYVVGYQNQNAKIDAKGEAAYFELGNSYNYGIGASADHGVLLTGGLRDGSRTTLAALAAKTFRADKLPGFPEYFKSFSLTKDGTGFGGTTGYRVIRIGADGSIGKSAPVY
jgi:hypothetical protein